LRAYRIIKEETRVIYELIDHDPENIKASKNRMIWGMKSLYLITGTPTTKYFKHSSILFC
jgi:hypothetical protein